MTVFFTTLNVVKKMIKCKKFLFHFKIASPSLHVNINEPMDWSDFSFFRERRWIDMDQVLQRQPTVKIDPILTRSNSTTDDEPNDSTSLINHRRTSNQPSSNDLTWEDTTWSSNWNNDRSFFFQFFDWFKFNIAISTRNKIKSDQRKMICVFTRQTRFRFTLAHKQ